VKVLLLYHANSVDPGGSDRQVGVRRSLAGHVRVLWYVSVCAQRDAFRGELWAHTGVSSICQLVYSYGTGTHVLPYFSRISANSSVILRPESSSRGSSRCHCVQLKKRWGGIWRLLRGIDERNVALAQIRIIEPGASCVDYVGVEARDTKFGARRSDVTGLSYAIGHGWEERLTCALQ
jgi:hypothetical protein